MRRGTTTTPVSIPDHRRGFLQRTGSKELLDLAKSRQWHLDEEGNYDYAGLHTRPSERVPAKDIATHNLTYAQELEKIV